MYELLDVGFEEGEKEFLAYFESTYIGRRIPSGGRRPLFEHHMWKVDHRMTIGSLRTNNATESPHCAISRGIAQSDHPTVYRSLESMQTQQNITCGAINIAPHKPNKSRDRRNRGMAEEGCRKEAGGEERANREPGSAIRRSPRQREIHPRSRLELHVKDEE